MLLGSVRRGTPSSLEPGIVAIGLDGFYTQFIYGLMTTVAVSLYAWILGRGR